MIVQIAERSMTVREITSLVPGAIIELPKLADEELDIMVNNVGIGKGTAVKVGENYGIKVTYIGTLKDRISALGGEDKEAELDTDALAEAEMLASM